MDEVLKNCEPKAVFAYFEELSRIPRESGHIRQVSDWLAAFAEEQGLACRQDEAGNVVIRKPASPGYEKAGTVMLQGHIDMVAARAAGSAHDFSKDPLSLRIEGDRVYAEDTTLGGDNGIAVAYALALLADREAKHPRLECVFTADEEVGMVGAMAMDLSDLEADYMINLDSDEEGIFTVSCAGGLRYRLVLPVSREVCAGTFVTLRLEGLLGGHSGTEINKGRLNAAKGLSEALRSIREEIPFRLGKIDSGGQDNVIPSWGEAVILLEGAGKEEALEALVSAIEAKFAGAYRETEPGLRFSVIKKEEIQTEVLTAEDTGRALDFLEELPNGVLSMSPDLAGLVQTSQNLGILSLEQDQLLATFSIRSSVEEEKLQAGQKLEEITKRFGGAFTTGGNYPGWQFEKESPFRDLAVKIFRELYGKEPVIEAIHAGLECGIFKKQMPALQILAMGPNLYDIHSAKESFSISSVRRVWEFLRALLSDMREGPQ